MTIHTDVGNVELDPEALSQKHRRIAEIIQDWDPTVFLVWIPPEQRAFNEEFPFGLLHRPEGKPEYLIRKLRTEEVNETLLTWLWSNDTSRTDVLGVLEAKEAAEKAYKLKVEMERREERNEIARAILTSPLNTYKHNGVSYR